MSGGGSGRAGRWQCGPPRPAWLARGPGRAGAFRLDRLLGIGHVSPSAPRRLSRQELEQKLDEDSKRMLPRILNETIFDASGRTAGEAQFWIPSIKDTELGSAAATKIWSEWLS